MVRGINKVFRSAKEIYNNKLSLNYVHHRQGKITLEEKQRRNKMASIEYQEAKLNAAKEELE